MTDSDGLESQGAKSQQCFVTDSTGKRGTEGDKRDRVGSQLTLPSLLCDFHLKGQNGIYRDHKGTKSFNIVKGLNK